MTARERGERIFDEVMRFAAPADDSPAMRGLVDFVFAEVWSRPGLSRRDRRFVTLACVAAAGSETDLRDHVNAALDSGDIDIIELREAVLQFAVYAGWPKASRFSAIVEERAGDQTPTLLEPVMSPEESFRTFNCVPFVPSRDNPFTGAVLDFVYGEVWLRPGLGVKERRLISLACAALQDAYLPIVSHVYAALKSRDLSFDEIDEVALQFAAYAGWPKASQLNQVIGEQKVRVRQEWAADG